MFETERLFLSKTFELARSAAVKGNHPFGAILVLDSRVVLEAENTVVESGDRTQHAELSLVSRASRIFSAAELARMTLYTSTEPCAMCAGAIYWVGVRHVVFGCSARRLGAIAGETLAVACREVLSGSKELVRIEGPLFENEAALIHQLYWVTHDEPGVDGAL